MTNETVTPALEHDHGLVHTAMIIGSAGELETVLRAELDRSAHRFDEVLLVVGKDTRAVLDERAGGLPGTVRWGDPAAFYQRLGFAYERFRRYLAEQHDAGRRVHVVAEPDTGGGVDAGMRAGRTAAYLAYEAICNETYAPYEGAVTCVWNAERDPAAVIDGVRATHRYLLTADGRVPSADYRHPRQYLAERHNGSWPPAPDQAEREVVLTAVADLGRLRAALHAWAAGHRFADEPADDLVVAVVEVAANGLRHGTPPVRVRAWRRHDTLVVQCDDTAGRPIPAVAGYRRPRPADAMPDGRGLWLARQLADVVVTAAEPGRTSVRLYFPYQVMHRRGEGAG